MTLYYNTFRRDESVRRFFDYFMDEFGLQCNELLYDCRLGDEKLDCCKVFKPEYLMRRGRCFRTIELYQRNYDELGKLRISLRQPYSMDPTMPTDEEILTFLAEHKRQIAPFPRYYLYPDTWTKARIMAKHIHLFPAEEVCSEESGGLSKDACYVQQWLETNLEKPHNCTYPYMHNVRNVTLPSCHPSTIVESYENTVEAPSYTAHSCVLACDRWEYTVTLERTPASVIQKNAKNLLFTYRIDVSYNDLQYEEIREVSTVTLAGLIAQIGGQLSLFMGSSILNLTQVVIMIVILTRRAMQKRRRGQRVSAEMPSSAHPVNYNWNNIVMSSQKFENAAFDESLESGIKAKHLADLQIARPLTSGPRASEKYLEKRRTEDEPTASSGAKSICNASPTRLETRRNGALLNLKRRTKKGNAGVHTSNRVNGFTKQPSERKIQGEQKVAKHRICTEQQKNGISSRSPTLSPLSTPSPPRPPPHYDTVNQSVTNLQNAFLL